MDSGKEGQMDKEAYGELIIATVMAATKKVTAGLRYAASGEYQDYPEGTLELGVALDAINMLANDVVDCVLANNDEPSESNTLLYAAAGFATIANNTTDKAIKQIALENYKAIREELNLDS